MSALNHITRGDIQYRCPSCGAICREPDVPVIGQPVTLGEHVDRDPQSH